MLTLLKINMSYNVIGHCLYNMYLTPSIEKEFTDEIISGIIISKEATPIEKRDLNYALTSISQFNFLQFSNIWQYRRHPFRSGMPIIDSDYVAFYSYENPITEIIRNPCPLTILSAASRMGKTSIGHRLAKEHGYFILTDGMEILLESELNWELELPIANRKKIFIEEMTGPENPNYLKNIQYIKKLIEQGYSIVIDLHLANFEELTLQFEKLKPQTKQIFLTPLTNKTMTQYILHELELSEKDIHFAQAIATLSDGSLMIANSICENLITQIKNQGLFNQAGFIVTWLGETIKNTNKYIEQWEKEKLLTPEELQALYPNPLLAKLEIS